ncbi:MAG: hypothetical protein C6Y22_20110 [Hapalosiphonaceae cyanobacterium JJU2]|nr:MAG: hypothetical protein C6Y22_20110 [Hapalosiphonaceae cyanobacterium JJU2]
MKTTIATVIKQQSTAIEQQSLSFEYSASNPNDRSLETLNSKEFDLERIMLEEFTYGLPSDIPMADF